MLWQLALGFALALALAVVVFIATRPAQQEVVETLVINDREARVFEVAIDLARWNPWAGPGFSPRFVGPPHGLGAGSEWDPQGALTITQVQASHGVTYLYEEGPRAVVLHLELAGDGARTTARWWYRRRLDFVDRAKAFFGASDELRRRLQRGLAALGARVEAAQRGEAPPSLLSCSFCGKTQREVRKLISGPNVFICDECIGLCNDIIADEVARDGVPPTIEKTEPELFSACGLPALRWGLSRADVVALVPSLADDRSNLVGALEQPPNGLEARCHFDPHGGLAGVSLRNATRALFDALTAALGEPARPHDAGVARWKTTTVDVVFDEGAAYVSFFSSAFDAPPPTEAGAAKVAELTRLLASGPARLVIDARRGDVVVPERFRGEARLMLNVSPRFTSTLHFDEGGVSQVLQFAKEEWRVVAPWAAVEAMGAPTT